MKGVFSVLLMFVIVLPSIERSSSASVFNVVDLGATGNGVSDDSNAFLKAWQAVCGSTEASPTLVIPKGKTFLLQPVVFLGPCKSASINVQLQGTITSPKTSQEWKWPQNSNKRAWISFSHINGLVVNGGGQIDGNGASWWKFNADSRPTALQFLSCDQLTVSELTHKNSPRNHISIDSCKGALISNLKIIAPELSPNTDGFDISKSSNIRIENSNIQTGDDCVAINSGSSFINITGVFCGPGHGISVGSLGKNGAFAEVTDINVRNCNFTNTQNGVRIKTWKGGRGQATRIKFEEIKFQGVKNPVVINQDYVDRLFNSSQTAVKVSYVTYRDVSGTSSGEKGIELDCDGSVGGCTNVVFENVDIKSASGGKATVTCQYAHGTSDSCNPPIPCLPPSYTKILLRE